MRIEILKSAASAISIRWCRCSLGAPSAEWPSLRGRIVSNTLTACVVWAEIADRVRRLPIPGLGTVRNSLMLSRQARPEKSESGGREALSFGGGGWKRAI